jgi:hypothetical protein
VATLQQDVGGDHGGGHVVVPQQVLNGVEVDAALTQVSAAGMTNDVGADMLRQTSAANRHLVGLVNDARVRMMASEETSRRVNGESQGRDTRRPLYALAARGYFRASAWAGRLLYAPAPDAVS